MKVGKGTFGVLNVLLSLVLLQGLAHAASYFQLGENPLEVKGKVQARLSWRTDRSEGFTFPSVATGNMVQERNLGLVELNQTLSKQTETTAEVKYHLVGRFLYDGIYDYGPKAFQDVRNANKAEIDNFKKDADVWEAYVDYTKGKGFLRIGRQNLSWGETDIFRLLDRINPLDDTFGGSFEDLDDRRIPIWMVRGTYNLGNVGPVSSLSLEGFWNPGMGGQKVSPMAPFGTPFAFPMPASTVPTRVHKPEKTFESSRMGARLQGVLGDNFNFSLAQYQTIIDSPAAIVTFDPAAAGGPVFQDLFYKTEWVTGGSVNFYEPHIEGVIRSEIAMFWNEPVFIPQVNAPVLFGDFRSGDIPKKNVLRYMVGLDKNFWIRALNEKSMFNVFFQYFAEYYPSYDDRMKIALPKFPTGEFMKQVRYDQKITMIAFTSYMEGTLTPQLALAYDPRGALMFIPSLQKFFDPWVFKVAYYGITGKDDVSVGILRDRDQASFTVTRLF
jgi:hypothetical protein